MDHSASRRVDVLELEAPHLIAPPPALAVAQRVARETAGTLRLAIATGRRELEERGAVSDDVWSTIEELAALNVSRLGDLERAERASSRP